MAASISGELVGVAEKRADLGIHLLLRWLEVLRSIGFVFGVKHQGIFRSTV